MPTEVEIDELKRHCQAQFSDGLVIIVGSGLSCAEGLPGMGELANHLRSEVGRHLDFEDDADWNIISELIRTKSLEPALLERPPGPRLQGVIASVTASFIGIRERTAIEEVFNGSRTLRLTRLMKHVLKSETGIPVITTNYDRLVEIAAEEAGLGVDSMFVGDFAGTLNAHEARFSHCRGVTFPKARSAKLQFRSRVVVSKPHGSLDWYLRGGKPVSIGGIRADCEGGSQVWLLLARREPEAIGCQPHDTQPMQQFPRASADQRNRPERHQAIDAGLLGRADRHASPSGHWRALLLGDAVLLPTRIRLDVPTIPPDSATREFWKEWGTRQPSADALTKAVENLRSQTRV